jgi:hypothetical protein
MKGRKQKRHRNKVSSPLRRTSTDRGKGEVTRVRGRQPTTLYQAGSVLRPGIPGGLAGLGRVRPLRPRMKTLEGTRRRDSEPVAGKPRRGGGRSGLRRGRWSDPGGSESPREQRPPANPEIRTSGARTCARRKALKPDFDLGSKRQEGTITRRGVGGLAQGTRL